MTEIEIIYLGSYVLIGYAFGIGIWFVSWCIRYLFNLFKMMSNG